MTVGNDKMLERHAVAVSGDERARIAILRESGQIVVHVAIGTQLAGVLGIEDPIKPSRRMPSYHLSVRGYAS